MAVLKITEENFKAEVLESGKPVLLDFWATWCGPCQMQGPVFEEAAEKLSDKAVFGKVNVDEEPGLAQQFGVMSIPTLILFRDGKAADTMVGFHPLEELEKIIAK
ncbi:MAG: thioredoxin [Lachnospiraceae bacterium]|nr:thioredoxin [Lachnospiraceae bacterium]MCI9149250.1 thioredoxin [Lachnospiraceae bacterium]